MKGEGGEKNSEVVHIYVSMSQRLSLCVACVAAVVEQNRACLVQWLCFKAAGVMVGASES